ncbi:hypothetical protein BOTBODRAFT_30140 [Botryobasidium botryosum FD-172 SS1]|uniref:Peptidase S33 tripeptidyl aminopeptidase-like C-terminal domain-containing protein n=1 Tax=Botryobasidium botryosum (strain FD-172 SS1) TaxID=930990 RepID=A0A067MZP0_BOTB1|nr:hypothetical protein BOTBODRAFT_30140 [Botryobasidium botryosum FD-172 SS1]
MNLRLALLALLSAAALVSGDLQWEKYPNSTLIETASYVVPLDWADASAGNATLAVMQYKSTVSPRLGSIFVNPGGPGGSGLDYILETGKTLSEYTGGQYDIVSWDPRGVGATKPVVKCFGSAAAEKELWRGTVPSTGLEARGNFTSQDDLDAFYAQADEVDTLLAELWKRCDQLSGGILAYVGTAATVRDMVSLADTIEGKGLINYWGISYGTIVGSYFVNMFPDRVGKVVIDGVVDPIYWADLPSYKLWGDSLTSTEDTFAGFTQACVMARYPSCALGNIAGPHTSPGDIATWVHQLLDDAYDYKKRGGDIGSASIRSRIMDDMENPTQWPELAKALFDMYNQIKTGEAHLTPLVRPRLHHRGDNNSTSDSDEAPDYSFQAITCADALDSGNATTRDVFDEIVRVTREVSPLFGPIFGDAGFYCHRWNTRAVERYTGPWNRTLANPILIIGNEADPITPFTGAKVVADLLGDSAVLIKQDDFGHTTLAERSNCTITVMNRFFTHGTLPVEGSVCGTNQVLFPAAPITKSSLAVFVAETSSDAYELNQLRQNYRALLGMDIALCAIVLVLLVALMLSTLRARKARNPSAPGGEYDSAHSAMLRKGDFKDPLYTTPYDALRPRQ